MKDRKYFSISVDSTPDANLTDQLTVIVGYVLASGPIEQCSKFLWLTSHKGKDMADLALEVQNKSNIDVFNCRQQSYNNASNMSGTYKGMQAEIKKHCAAYSLNLVAKSATTCCIESANFFQLSMSFKNFFGIYLLLESHEGYP